MAEEHAYYHCRGIVGPECHPSRTQDPLSYPADPWRQHSLQQLWLGKAYASATVVHFSQETIVAQSANRYISHFERDTHSFHSLDPASIAHDAAADDNDMCTQLSARHGWLVQCIGTLHRIMRGHGAFQLA